MTMKEAEEALQNAPHFYRCHRSFLVNGGMVEEVLGNSQAYRLKLMYLEESVPVSRSFDIEPLRK
jgi:DNA-binding LytR/AlgR family response regulator